MPAPAVAGPDYKKHPILTFLHAAAKHCQRWLIPLVPAYNKSNDPYDVNASDGHGPAHANHAIGASTRQAVLPWALASHAHERSEERRVGKESASWQSP